MYLFQKDQQGSREEHWIFYPLRGACSADPSATAESTVGQEHKTGLNTAAKVPVMSRAVENHPDTHSGMLRPLATLAGAREKVEWSGQSRLSCRSRPRGTTPGRPRSSGRQPGCRDAIRGGPSLLHATQHSLLWNAFKTTAQPSRRLKGLLQPLLCISRVCDDSSRKGVTLRPVSLPHPPSDLNAVGSPPWTAAGPPHGPAPSLQPSVTSCLFHDEVQTSNRPASSATPSLGAACRLPASALSAGTGPPQGPCS